VDREQRATAATLTGTATQINSVAFSPDGKYLAGGGQNDITLWELPAGSSPKTLVRESSQHSDFNSVAFSADGRYLAGTSITGLDLWAVAAWQAVPITTALNQGVLDAFAFGAGTARCWRAWGPVRISSFGCGRCSLEP
jgi:WD40 repeat protein